MVTLDILRKETHYGNKDSSSCLKKGRYYLSKHRYYELRHFCLQYYEWEEEANRIHKIPGMGFSEIKSDPGYLDPTFDAVSRLLEVTGKMDMVKECCNEAGGDIAEYLFKAVTEDLAYPQLKTMLDIPCGRDYYYERYRQFFAVLDEKRN